MINIKTTSPRIRSLVFFIRELFGGVFYPDLKSFVWRRHVCAPRKLPKHLSLSCAIETQPYYSRALTR